MLNRPGFRGHFRAVGICVFRKLPKKCRQTCCGDGLNLGLPFKNVARLGHPLELGLLAAQILGLSRFVQPLAKGHLLLLRPLVQAVSTDSNPGRNPSYRMTPLDELSDRVDLEVFYKSLLTHGTYY